MCKLSLVPVVDNNSAKNMRARSTSTSFADSPSLEDSIMVPTGSRDVDQFSVASAQDGGLNDLSNRERVYHASWGAAVIYPLGHCQEKMQNKRPSRGSC